MKYIVYLKFKNIIEIKTQNMGSHQSLFAKKEQEAQKKTSLLEYVPNKTTVEQEQNEIKQNSLQGIVLQQFESVDKIIEDVYTYGNSKSKIVKVTKYFNSHTDLQSYISNILKIRKIINIEIYDDLSNNSSSNPYEASICVQAAQTNIIDKSTTIHDNLSQKMDLLIFVASLLNKIQNIYFTPADLLQVVQGIYLINFEISKYSKQKIVIAFIRWLFGNNIDYVQCIQVQYMQLQGIPTPIQQIYESLSNKTGSFKNYFIEKELKYVKDKLIFLTGRIDSFYACSYFKKSEKFMAKKQWLTIKRGNEVFFYHIQDFHASCCKIIRKKRKIDITSQNIVFDPEQLQIIYIPENSKIIVRANQFDLQQQSSTTDIEIKYKLPVKFKNPLLCMTNSGQILILQGFLYKYIPITNKLIQMTRKLSDYIFITNSKENLYFIVKISIDIFKNGIRTHYKNQDITLSFTGDKSIVDEISTFRIDIKSVNFCIEVYRGVYLMMASRNLWILDMNFECFFSYATPIRLKNMGRGSVFSNEPSANDMIFKIYNQPFKVNFAECVDQNCVIINKKFLHILGKIQNQPYYFKYQFLHNMGALKLIGYQPVFVSSTFKQLDILKKPQSVKKYHFNFHEESLNSYKYGDWIFDGDLFLKVYDFHIKWQKTNYQMFLIVEAYKKTLKDILQQMINNNYATTRRQTLLLLYKIYIIFEQIFNRSITHKNFSISNLCLTNNQKVKIHGWSQPPRNWHISDFKDYLLTCFNIITVQTYEKLSEKIVNSHQKQLVEYPVFHQKLLNAIKQPKTIQKKTQIQKNLYQFKAYLQKQLSQIIHVVKSTNYLFSFQYGTPRFNIFNIQTQKMRKVTIIPQENSTQQFLFSQKDRYEWSQYNHSLYIFTASYQFYQAKISLEPISQQKIVLQDYEYLPNNISESTFICVGAQLFSFGGVKKETNGKSCYCTSIYNFNRNTLMWDPIGILPQPRINPKISVSCDHRSIFIIGGLTDHQFSYFRPIEFNILSRQCNILVDRSIMNPISYLNPCMPLKIFHLSRQMNLFMFWYLDNNQYVMNYLCCLSTGFNVIVRVRNFNPDNMISNLSVGIQNNDLHILRIYGKYSKITLNNFENGNIKNQTIYAI